MNEFEYLLNDETVATKIEKSGDGFKMIAGEVEATFEPDGQSMYHVEFNGKRYSAAVVKSNGTYFIDIDSMLFEVKEIEDDFAGGGGHAGEKDKIFAPMPGKIVKLLVAIGDKVVEKQPMVIVEAMKMENQVSSKAAGSVKAINFSAGDQVDTDTPIIELDIEE